MHQGQFQPTSVPQCRSQMLGQNNGERHTKKWKEMDEQQHNGTFLVAGMVYSIQFSTSLEHFQKYSASFG